MKKSNSNLIASLPSWLFLQTFIPKPTQFPPSSCFDGYHHVSYNTFLLFLWILSTIDEDLAPLYHFLPSTPPKLSRLLSSVTPALHQGAAYSNLPFLPIPSPPICGLCSLRMQVALGGRVGHCACQQADSKSHRPINSIYTIMLRSLLFFAEPGTVCSCACATGKWGTVSGHRNRIRSWAVFVSRANLYLKQSSLGRKPLTLYKDLKKSHTGVAPLIHSRGSGFSSFCIKQQGRSYKCPVAKTWPPAQIKRAGKNKQVNEEGCPWIVCFSFDGPDHYQM